MIRSLDDQVQCPSQTKQEKRRKVPPPHLGKDLSKGPTDYSVVLLVDTSETKTEVSTPVGPEHLCTLEFPSESCTKDRDSNDVP